MSRQRTPSTRRSLYLRCILMSMMSLIAGLHGASAKTNETTIPATQLTTSADQSSEDPMYFLGRFSLIVPENSTRMITTSSVGFGIFSENQRHAFGIRFSWIPNPPENPLAEEEDAYIRMDHAFGPLFDWRFFLNPNSRMTFYTVASAGFVFGSPNKESREFADQNDRLEEPTNQILPVLEFGLGVIFSKKLGARNELFLNPEFGVVPGLSAPYMSLSAGFNI